MPPGNYRKDPLEFQEVIIGSRFINNFDHVISVDVEGHDEHRNMHGCVSLQEFDTLKWFEMLAHV